LLIGAGKWSNEVYDNTLLRQGFGAERGVDPIDSIPAALSTFLPFPSDKISGSLFILVEPGTRLFDFLRKKTIPK